MNFNSQNKIPDDCEAPLKRQLTSILNNDFEIVPEVSGKSLIADKTVIIDFLLYPMQHMIAKGFDAGWFGIEVKYFKESGLTGKMAKFMWQSISYQQSAFCPRGESTRPLFVLCFSNILQLNSKNDFGNLSQWCGMQRVGGYSHVGEFNITKYGWIMSISSSYYFSKKKDELKRHKLNIQKPNIGNCAN